VQNKGSMLAFTFVLLVMCVGAFAAFSVLTTGRGLGVGPEASGTPTEDIATRPPDATPAPTDTPLDEAAETPEGGEELSTPVAPSPTLVPAFTPTPPPTATSTAGPSPTREEAEPGPPPSRPGQYNVISNERDCSATGIIGGWVYDSAGNGLGWASLHLYNNYGWSATKQSEGPPQAGKYEFTMGSDAGLFHLVIVDEGGHPLSPVVDIDYQPDCSQRIDWERAG